MKERGRKKKGGSERGREGGRERRREGEGEVRSLRSPNAVAFSSFVTVFLRINATPRIVATLE